MKSDIENILFRRTLEHRLEGYTLETTNEIVALLKPSLETLWKFIELVARGNTEMIELERIASNLIEEKYESGQELHPNTFEHRKRIALNESLRTVLEPVNPCPEKEAADILTDCCQILDVVKQEWGKENCWSSWDQSVRDAVTEWLRRFYSMRCTHPDRKKSGGFNNESI